MLENQSVDQKTQSLA